MYSWNSLCRARLAHVIILTAVVAFASTPAQAQVSIGGFSIGGTDATFAIDVASTKNTVEILDKGDGNVEGFGNASELGPTNGTNTKLGVIHNALPTMLSSTNPNPGVDLRKIWLGSSLFNNEGYLYFAWERDSKNGSGVVLFEFQQDPVPTGCNLANINTGTCNPWSNRQPGDFLIVWDQSGSTINIIKRTFMFTDSNLNNAWDRATEPLFLDAGSALNPNHVKAATSPDGFMGEAAINLSQTVFQGLGGRCLSIANVIPGTVTGNSDTADYKDTLLFPYPQSVAISSCGTVLIRKDSGAGTSGSFPYEFKRAGGAALKYSGETLLNGTFTGHYADETGDTGETDSPVNGFVKYEDIIGATNYLLSETTPLAGGWSLSSIICKAPENGNTYTSAELKDGAQFEVKINILTVCTIVNVQVPRTLKVKKVVLNNFGLSQPGSAFKYKLVRNGVETTNLTFLDGAAEQTYSVAIGTTYNVIETTQATGYGVTYDGCNGTIVAGVDPTCTVTNTASINANAQVITRQVVILQDKAYLSLIRRGAGETAANVEFKLFSDSGCQAQLGSTQTVAVNWGTDTTSENITLGTSNLTFVIERPQANAGTLGPLVRYWTARYTGNNFNSAKVTDCAEVTSVTLAP